VVGFAVLSACSIVAAWWAELVPPGRESARAQGSDIETTGEIG